MKKIIKSVLLKISLPLLLLVAVNNEATAQVDCEPIVCLAPLTAPGTIDGVSFTDSFTGGVTYYGFEFVSCMDSVYRTPADCRHIGTGAFTYTVTFSEPVNGVCFILTATGQFVDEVFTITTDAGIPTIGDEGSCFTSIVGNVINTGAGADGLFDCDADPVFAGGGGGMFRITNPGGAYSSFTITGPGGEAGSLFALCSLCPIESESTIEHTNVTCFGECDGEAEVIDGALGPYTYLWDPGAGGGTDATATGLCPGTYSVEVTDVSGLVQVLEVTITEPDEIIGAITAQIDVSCFGLSDGSVTVEAVGGTGALTYDIGAGPIDIGEFTDLAAGIYTVTVTDENGCTTDIPVEILEPELLLITEVVVTGILCNGGTDGSIEVVGSGGTAPYTYNIDGGIYGDVTVYPDLAAGDYTFGIMDDNGCEASIIISLTDPDPITVDEIVTHEICLGDCVGTITLVASGGTGVLTYSIDGCVTSDVIGDFTDLCAGDYDICVEDENGCQYTSTLTVNPGTTDVDPTIVPFGPLCVNDTPVTLDATDIGVFTGPGVIAGVFNPAVAGAGTHTITNTIDGGCGSAVANFDITVNPLPVVTFIVNENAHCVPLEAVFTNTGTIGISCEWNFGDGSISTVCGGVSHTYGNAGTYDVSLTITDANGCSATATYYDYIEVYPLPTANFIFDPINPTTIDTEVDFTDYSINADAWIWDFGGYGNSTDQNPSFIFPEQEGTYDVTLIAITDKGCRDTITKRITVNQEQLIFVPNVITPDGDLFNEVFTPYFTGIDIYDYHLTIYNRWGETLFESYNLATGWNGTYGGELVQDGVYIWHITTAEIATDKKLEFHGHVTLVK